MFNGGWRGLDGDWVLYMRAGRGDKLCPSAPWVHHGRAIASRAPFGSRCGFRRGFLGRDLCPCLNISHRLDGLLPGLLELGWCELAPGRFYLCHKLVSSL
jgi:hypothetical protein